MQHTRGKCKASVRGKPEVVHQCWGLGSAIVPACARDKPSFKDDFDILSATRIMRMQCVKCSTAFNDTEQPRKITSSSQAHFDPVYFGVYNNYK